MTTVREPEEPSDLALVAEFQADPQGEGGRSAAALLLRRYRDRIYVWCFHQLGRHEEALDVSQETLVAAFHALPRFEGRSEFSSWIFAIARYRCISARRARPRLLDDEFDLEALPDGSPDPEVSLLAKEAQARTLAVMNEALDVDERTALWLRASEEMSVEEITRVLNLSGASGARALLQRARRKLRAALEAQEALEEEGGRA